VLILLAFSHENCQLFLFAFLMDFLLFMQVFPFRKGRKRLTIAAEKERPDPTFFMFHVEQFSPFFA